MQEKNRFAILGARHQGLRLESRRAESRTFDSW
jgi:hypothetical protein